MTSLRAATYRQMTNWLKQHWLEPKLKILVSVPSHNLLQLFRFSERCNFWRLKYVLLQ